MEFTYEAYLDLLSNIKKHGFIFADYETCDNYERCVILRHDIDYSLDKAVKLAEIEASEGVSSTYFTLISSEFYNPIAKENYDKIHGIQELGHKIGLHFDEMNYGIKLTETDIKKKIIDEIRLMEQILNIDIKSVSMHRPSKQTLEADYQLGSIVNSYGKKFFKDFKYVSDSRRRWREDINRIIDSGEYNKLHILTHAFWYNEKDESIEASIGKFIKNGNADRYNMLERNITDLGSIIPKEGVK